MMKRDTEVHMLLSLLILPAAMAQAPELPPEPPDGDVLLTAARDGLKSPPGCHVLEGTVTTSIGVGPIRDQEVHTLTGTLNQGDWSELSWTAVSDKKESFSFHVSPEEDGELTPFFPPMFGSVTTKGVDMLGAEMLLDGILSEFSPDTATVTSMYDFIGEHKVFAVSRLQTLVRERKDRDVSLYALLEMDTLQPRSWRVEMDKRVKVDSVTIRDVVLEMEADAAGVPTRERFEGIIRHGPFVVRVAQEIHYTRTGDCQS